MKNLRIIILALALVSGALFQVASSQTSILVGGTTYPTLKSAFDAINAGTIKGAIILQITASTTETASAIINASGTGSSSYTSITIYPTVSGLTISGSIAAGPLVDLNGADYVTFDGRVNQAGNADLTISNTNSGSTSSAIRLYNSAVSNTFKYCYIKGSGGGYGVISFTSSSSGSGNNNNIVSNNNITNSGTRPVNAIYSAGSSVRENSSNTVSNNNIYDFLSSSFSSNGINLASASSNWIISGNSFYETTTLVPTAANTNCGIRVSTGSPHTVSGNYIGGSLPLCGGSAMTINASLTHYFVGIYANGGTSTATTIQNNIIRNINYTSTNSNPWDGIYIAAGNVDVIGNTVGATTGTGSITINTPVASAYTTISGGVVTGITLNGGGSGYTIIPVITFSTNGSTSSANATAIISGGSVTGFTLTGGGSGYTSAPSVLFDNATYSTSHAIRNFSLGLININNNNISSITTVGSSTYSSGFECIILNTVSTTASICNNLVGSLVEPNSIYISASGVNSLVKQDIFGIYSMSPGTTVIRGNTIANLTNGYTGTNTGTRTRPIATTAGANTIENNTIHDIKTSSGQNQAGSNASLIGIAQTSSSGELAQSITGNIIYNLYNNNPSAKVELYGIYSNGTTEPPNQIYNNFIHDLLLSTSNVTSVISGININVGKTICANNIVNLSNSSLGYNINGIADNSAAACNSKVYFNSVYIGGSVTSGVTSSSYALCNTYNSTTKIYKNNILFNARYGGTTGKHYAIFINGTSNLTIDNNDYFVSGSNSVLGYLSSDKTTLALWKSATGQDQNSLNTNPGFFNPGGNNSSDYIPSATLPAVTGTEITTDYYGNTRNTPPIMGALEYSSGYVWSGATSTDFNTASNWLGNLVPSSGADITFAQTPLNNCILDQNRTLGSVTNSQSTYKLFLNGKQLTITGNLNFTNSAQIDASSASSKIIFNGSSAQSIPSGAFYNNSIYNFELNNSSGLTLNGNLTVANSLTLTNGVFNLGPGTFTLSGNSLSKTSGQLNASASTLIFANSSTITLPSGIFSTTLNNLSISGAGGIISSNDISINGILNLASSNPSATVGILDMGSFTLSMGSSATTTGLGDVTGIVKRTSFIANTSYTFGNQFTSLSFPYGSIMPTFVSIKLTLGSSPSWKADAVKRYYDIVRSGGSDSTLISLSLHYIDNELNSNTESNLVIWDYHYNQSGKVEEHGKANQSTTDKWVSIVNRRITYFDSTANTHLWTLSNKVASNFTWQGTPSKDWNDPSNWSGGVVPTTTSDVVIPSTDGLIHNPSLPTSTEIRSLTIEANGVLNAGSATLYINGTNGAWSNLGTFNSGTSKVIFNRGSNLQVATVSGTTDFYNIECADYTTMQPVAGCILRIAGNGTAFAHSVVDFSTINNTVEYNGTDQTIVNPNGIGGNSGYYNLILSNSGTKSMPLTPMTINGSLTISGSVNLTPNNTMNISGNLEINSGCTFNPGAFSHTISGYINAVGTLTTSSGSTVTMNSPSANIISGTDTVKFNNLIINSGSEIKLAQNIIVNNTLTLTNGSLNTNSNSITFINGNTPISVSGGYLTLDANTNLIFGTSGNTGGNAFTIPNNAFSNPAQQINSFSINRTNSITLGQELNISGSLNLESGNIILNSNNLNLGINSAITGNPSTNSFINASSTGEFRKYFPDNNKVNNKHNNKDKSLNSFVYPLGTGASDYSPVTISFSSGTFTNAYIGVTNVNSKNSNNPSMFDYLNRYWVLSQNGITGFSADVTFNYLPGDVFGTESNIYTGKYNGVGWVLLGVANSIKHTLSGTVTDFNTFTGGQQGAMPISLSSFGSTVAGRNIKLSWITSSEINNSGFEVLRSSQTDSSKYLQIGYINGSGTVNTPSTYNFEDKNLTSGKYKYRLKQIDNNGNFEYYNLNNTVEIGIPTKFNLSQNYPNPFNPVTKIDFDLPKDSRVSIKVYDMLGREVKTIFDDFRKAGYYTAVFDASSISSGVYFYRIMTDGETKFIMTKKLVVLK